MSDITTRVHALPAKKRALLAQLLKKKKASQKKRESKTPEVAPTPPATQVNRDQYDVLILGGGLAGLSLARQLKQARAETTILVVEKRQHPVPEAAFKIGESTVEGGAYYFSQILGMKRHLHKEQLLKVGLRYFFPQGNNDELAKRVELGAFTTLPQPSYQIDRGRFENTLVSENHKLGIAFWDACKVESVSLDASSWHSVTFSREGSQHPDHTPHHTIKARWVVDASGRAGLLKRQLDLAKPVSHDVNAAWFRVDEAIDLEAWSDSSTWRKRVFKELRRLSTNHLMGEGYWVWLIPLASGSTSIGIVADHSIHPFKEINRRERALSWLRRHEPQCANAISEDKILDFAVLRRYAHDCKQVFSTDRWCITGEAGVFTDPFYSLGSDLIAFSNIFITNLILRELAGENIAPHVEFCNRFYLDLTFDMMFSQFQYHYTAMGNPKVMIAKVVWDFAIYWATGALLIFHPQHLCDLDLMLSIEEDLWRCKALQTKMQTFFREWGTQEQPEFSNTHVDYGNIDFMYQLQSDLAAGLTGPELKKQITKNVSLLEKIASLMQAGATGSTISTDLQTNLSQIWLD